MTKNGQKNVATCNVQYPEVLQRNLFYFAAYELEWREEDGSTLGIQYIFSETHNKGNVTRQIENKLEVCYFQQIV